MQREQFSSHFTTVLTMIGVSVGLGNVWRFPYMMGKYGGSAFLFIYLLFTITLAIPAVIAEWTLARESRSGPLGAFRHALGHRMGSIVGYMLIFTVLIADSYYIVIISYICYTIYFISFNGFTQANIADYSQQLSDPVTVFTISLILLTTSLYVIYRGLKNGIEKISKFFVPFFGIVIIYLVIYTNSLDGATEKLIQFLSPDFSQINIETLYAALGQAFFSLGLGGTFLVIYGSYISDDEPLVKSAFLTALGDTGSALMASLFIIPAILLFSFDMSSGPTLLFSTLPELFATMPLGRILGSFFLIALFMVAYLSNIAALEVIFGGIQDEKRIHLNRKKLVILIGIIELILISLTSYKPNLIETLDLIFGSGMQVLGSCLALIAVSWFLGKTKVYQQVFKSVTKPVFKEIFFILIKYLIPLILLIVLVVYIIQSITG